MEPRSFDRGKSPGNAGHQPGPDVLQSSPDLSIAENPLGTPGTSPARTCFNRTPIFRSRKQVLCKAKPVARTMLQWSRDLSIAETRPSPPSSPKQPDRFNGAAIFRSRKLIEAHNRSHAPLSASMGPRSFDRGNPIRPRFLRVRLDASMEPRSFDRGNALKAYRASKVCACFNGAAIFRSRKPIPGRDYRPDAGLASMEPRSFDRGNDPWPCLHAKCRLRFNGAAIFRSRKPASRSQVKPR